MVDRSGGPTRGNDPQIVVPGTPSPGGSRVISPSEIGLAGQVENPIIGAITQHDAGIKMLGAEVQNLGKGLSRIRIGVSAIKAAIVVSLGEEGKKFDAMLAVYEQQFSDMHNMFVKIGRERLAMKEQIELARDFNMSHEVQVDGDQLQLVEYLNENPDKLEDSERDALAMEFGLSIRKKEDMPEEEVADA